MNPENGRFKGKLKKMLVMQNVFQPWSSLLCAIRNTKSLLGFKNKLDTFWNKNHWMDMEMVTENHQMQRRLWHR